MIYFSIKIQCVCNVIEQLLAVFNISCILNNMSSNYTTYGIYSSVFPQLGSLIYLPNNIIPQDEVLIVHYYGFYALNLVALNQPHTGDMMGLDVVDRMCYEQAKAMGLPPNYRAFISSHRQDLVHVVYPGFRETLPVTNLRGDVMFRNWRSVFNGDGGPINSRIPIYSFDGRDVLADPFWPQKSIWHGSTSRGLRVVDKHCEMWRADHMSSPRCVEDKTSLSQVSFHS
uniref:Collagenase NC10/endostatin domain-containing protein n=1 Tax=Lates calcarifer TaxID=8187 RepID=A0A4W6G6F5_LATCA